MTALRIKAVIFDLDGLVLDSETTYVAAWRHAAAEMGYTLDDTLGKSLSGLHSAGVEQRLQDHFGSEFNIEPFRRLSGEFWISLVEQQGIPVKKGFFTVLSLIESLSLPFCLATNSLRPYAMRCLDLAGLQQVFKQVITRDDVEYGKPAPDLFIAAATALGMATRDCLVLEDSPVGVAAAFAAGSPCVYVPSVYPVDDLAAANAVAVLDDLEQAAGFISACLDHSF